MPDSPFAALAAASYVQLETFRRDGRAVPTPVWIAGDAARLYAFSMQSAGKVKRVRATGRVRLAPCTMRGKVLGEAVEGRARVLSDPEEEQRVRNIMLRKYPVGGWFSFVLGRWTGRSRQHAFIEIVPV